MRKVQVIFIVWLILAIIIYVLNGSKAAAAMFIVAALYCALAAVMVFLSGRKMSVRISTAKETRKNEPVEITVAASSNSRIPIPTCRPRLTCVNKLTKEEKNLELSMPCGPKKENVTTIKLTDMNCGCIEIAAREALITDPAGLFMRKQKLDAEAVTYIMPEIRGIEIPSSYLDAYDMESYAYSQNRKGNDTGEVFDIREYADGDSPKQIHWKLSAKLDDLMVRIPSYPIENKFVILLDNSIAEGIDLSPEKRSDLMELFFSVSSALIKKNITHSIGWCDHETGGFVLKRVESEGGMWLAVPEALSAGIEQSDVSTAYRFLESHAEDHFNKHFIVTAADAADTVLLYEYGDVKVFNC